MDFIDKLKQHVKKIEIIKDSLLTEEATKTALVMPFFKLLEYDVFNPMEFVPEYVADVGSKKGEKVDYAIMSGDKPIILIECKGINDNLTNHYDQLFRYFISTEARIAILTNGVIYKFFTDIDECNKMDKQPFLEINLLDLNEVHIPTLKTFTKDNFDMDAIFNMASELKYTNLIIKQLTDQLNNPSSEFVKFIISDFFDGSKTISVIDKFKPIVKKSMYQFVNDFMNDKLKSVLNNNKNDENEDINIDELESKDISMDDNKVGINEEKLEGFNIVRSILSEVVSADDIGYKDVERYFSVQYNGKWICRLYFNSSKKSIFIPNEDKIGVRYRIDNVSDIYKYKNELLKSLNNYLDKSEV